MGFWDFLRGKKADKDDVSAIIASSSAANFGGDSDSHSHAGGHAPSDTPTSTDAGGSFDGGGFDGGGGDGGGGDGGG